MKFEAAKFSTYGLFLALTATVISGAYYFLYRKFDIPLQIGLVLVVAGLASFAALDPERVRKFFIGRQFKYGSNSLILLIGVSGILVVINFFANKYSEKWDISEDRLNTLAPETIAALKSAPEQITALAFYTPSTSREQAENLLANMKENSAGRFEYEFIDPDSDPASVQKYQITKDGSIVLLMGEKSVQAANSSEMDLVTAIIKLTNPSQPAIYFISGHGEHDPFASNENSYSALKDVLLSKNYRVESLNLLTTGQIPADAAVIIVGGPQKPLSQQEVDLLRQFSASGKSMIILEDPAVKTQFGTALDPLAEYIKTDWGITLSNDFVVDANSQNPTFAIADEYGDNPIVNKLNGMVTIFPSSRSVVAAQTPPADVNLVTLVKTVKEAWGESDLATLEQGTVDYNEGQDLPGPVPLSVAGNHMKSNARIVVVGNSNFVINKNFAAYGNSDFMVNAVDWAAQEDQLISLTPKTAIQRFMVPPQSLAMNLLLLVSLILIPILVLAAGVMVYVHRRNKG